MKFFKKELCKQLDDLGCVSETQFAYYHNWPSPIYDIAIYPKPHEQIIICNAFSIYDFLSDEDYAEENCRKLSKAVRLFKQCIIESKNQEAYIEEAVNRVIKENNNG